MTSPSTAEPHVPTAASPNKSVRKWLLFVHQLPANGSNLRVRTWRRLQQLGAIPVKQAVYVLPDTPSAREDFEWLKTEIKDAGGDASVFAADSVDTWSDDALVQEFRRARQETYEVLARDVERVLTRMGTRRRSGTRAPAIGRLLDVFRQRLTAIEHVDFFGSAGRDRVVTLLAQVEAHASKNRSNATAPAGSASAEDHRYHGRLWVTRPRPGVDRMASAWLIRRFIDPAARFAFVADRDAARGDMIPFDMFGVEFTHRSDHCTFETLCAVFGIDDPAVKRLAAIVHDLDLKDARFGPPEAPTVGMLIDGLQFAYADDHELLSQGMVLFDALHRSVEHAVRPTGPRVVAPKRMPSRAARSSARSRSRTRS